MSKKYIPFAWIGMMLMTVVVLVVGEAGLQLMAFGYEETYKLADLGELAVIEDAVRYVTVPALVCMLFVTLSTQNRSRLWYVPMAIAGCVDTLCMLSLQFVKDKAIADSGLEGMMGLLSIECEVMDSAWIIAGMSMLVLTCGVIPFVWKERVTE